MATIDPTAQGLADAACAVEAAQSMAARFGRHVAILPDLSVKLLADLEPGEMPLEIIRSRRDLS